MSAGHDRAPSLRSMVDGRRPFDAGRRETVSRQLATTLASDEKCVSSFLSVVIPAKDEADSLAQLIDEVACALRPLCGPPNRELGGFEILVVDDASQDRTQCVLRDLVGLYPELKGLVLASGVGQSAATMAGIQAARGQWIATLDADLQNDPADLVRLWRALPPHDSAVLGWRFERQDTWFKRMVSYWANRLRNAILGQSIRDTGCSVRIFSRRVALRLPVFHGMHRFWGSLLIREGCELVQLPVRHRRRFHGRSHYNLCNRSVRVAVDLLGVAWLMNRPLHCRVSEVWGSMGESRGCTLDVTSRAGAGSGRFR